MSFQRLYSSSRPVRWLTDVLAVGAMVGALAFLHALPSLGLLTNETWQKL